MILARRLAAAASFCCAVQLGFPALAQVVDPLEAEVEMADAERFARLFRETDGTPDAAAIEADYLTPGSPAIEVFTPNRIVDAERMERAIAANPDLYRDAVERCLPWVAETQGQLRATYLGFHGLLPEAELPRIAVVFGGNNSGGTAAPGMQVLGLEVLCRLAPDRTVFDRLMEGFFAHEAVHSLQDIDRSEFNSVELGLSVILAEGTADYLALLVTGNVPDPERDAWARENSEMVWREFAGDVATMMSPDMTQEQEMAIAGRWVGNASNPPEGWPGELGYWIGMNIAQGYVENAGDRRAAIRELLVLEDPLAVLAASGLAPLILPGGD